MSNPKISVIVPVYNVEDYLEDALNSIVNQTFDDIEVLMIDDGSTDNSRYIIEKYALDYDNFYAFHKKNDGLPITRNYGLKFAKGEYVYFMDSDDFLISDAFEKMYNCASKYNSDVVTANFYRYNDNKTWFHIINEYVFNELESNLYNVNLNQYHKLIWDMPVWNKIYKKEFLDENNIRFVNDRVIFEDNIFSTEIYIKAKTVSVLKDCVYCWRKRVFNESLSQSHDKNRGNELFVMAKTVNELLTENIQDKDILTKKYTKWLILDIPFYMSKIDHYPKNESNYIFEGAYNLVRLIPNEYLSYLNNYYQVFYKLLLEKEWDKLYELISNNLKKNPANVVNIEEDYVNLFDFTEDAKNEKLKSYASTISSNDEDIIVNLKTFLDFKQNIEEKYLKFIIKNSHSPDICLDCSQVIDNKLYIPINLINNGVNIILTKYCGPDFKKECLIKTDTHKTFSFNDFDICVRRDKFDFLKLIKREKNNVELIIDNIVLNDNVFEFRGYSNKKLNKILLNDYLNIDSFEYVIEYYSNNKFNFSIDFNDFLKFPIKKWELKSNEKYGKINLAKSFKFISENYIISIKNDINDISINFELYNAIKKIGQLDNEILNLENENKKLIKKNKSLSNEIKKFKSRKIVRFADKIKKLK